MVSEYKKKSYAVCVTAEDIKNGKPNDIFDCPVALAVRRVLPSGTVVRVNEDSIFTGQRWSRLPSDVTDRIMALDYFGAMQPFEFNLEV